MKKKIDAIKLVRQIRDENYEKAKKLSRDEQFEDIKKRSAEARIKFLSDSKS
jgi:ribosomal protein L7/L12